MSVFLNGLSLKNYRGIGAKTQRISPFKKCNFFIGINNSGKSCVLNFIAGHLEPSSGSGPVRLSLSPLEVHLGATAEQIEVGFAVPTDIAIAIAKQKLVSKSADNNRLAARALSKLFHRLSEDGMVWTTTMAVALDEVEFSNIAADELWTMLETDEWRILWTCLTGNTGGDLINHWVPDVSARLRRLLRLPLQRPKIVPAKRQIGAKGKAFEDFSGVGLIDRLAELQNPGPTERHLKQNFEKINQFLRDVTGDETAMIEIPHDRHEVLVHKEQRVLPLSSLGTGIHEVVMIAAFCTLTEGSIVCIEEPEIHLHPLLQKKLIRYIMDNTDNQYFIATHSASVIDQSDAAVFHVIHSDQSTKIQFVASSAQRFKVCHDLGYRASDLLQANAVIWVEGPSDRIYLKHWISLVEPTLKEGIHYVIMF